MYCVLCVLSHTTLRKCIEIATHIHLLGGAVAMCITKRQIQIHKYKIHNRDSHTHRLAGGVARRGKVWELGHNGEGRCWLARLTSRPLLARLPHIACYTPNCPSSSLSFHSYPLYQTKPLVQRLDCPILPATLKISKALNKNTCKNNIWMCITKVLAHTSLWVYSFVHFGSIHFWMYVYSVVHFVLFYLLCHTFVFCVHSVRSY